ncbi:LacI family DNA-binding transcriptional regulator [Desertihabitans aurantiacus]|uniref:LacI family DNA-binding transcriptional regulator n=1 Tax=Desertihabitans aurantiacus TaxID=2282477 RepID=UPI000DF771A4|nr:LacI family DNA-binding transcriptional regulator [Desertihabitans aurantiacus]
MRRPSQRDIARRANVSQTAVSLVLNGKAAEHSISATTEARIRQAMAELSYVPDAAARSLRGGRSDLIGVHTFEPVFPVGPDDYFHEFLVGIEERAVELGRDLVLFASTQRPDGRRSIYGNGSNRLRLADGTVVIGLDRDDDELRRLSAEQYPFVVLGRRDSLPGVASVGVDYVSGVTRVVGMLAAAGHREIAYLRGVKHETPQRDRRTAYTDALSALGASPRWYDIARLGRDHGPARWRADGATAVLVEAAEDAAAVQARADAVGVMLPAQLSVVCLDGVSDPAATHWSQLRIPKRAVGARTLSVLADILDGRLPADHQELHPCEERVVPTTISAPLGD